MRKCLLFLIVFLSTFLANSQKETRLSFYTQSILVDNFKAYSISPTIDISVSDNLNIRYSIGFGMRGSGNLHAYTFDSSGWFFAVYCGIGT
jgi:hypothetical protein